MTAPRKHAKKMTPAGDNFSRHAPTTTTKRAVDVGLDVPLPRYAPKKTRKNVTRIELVMNSGRRPVLSTRK